MRMVDIAGVAMGAFGLFVVTVHEYDHRDNDVLSYQRWAFKKVDSFFGVSEADLVAAGWEPKKPRHGGWGNKRGF